MIFSLLMQLCCIQLRNILLCAIFRKREKNTEFRANIILHNHYNDRLVSISTLIHSIDLKHRKDVLKKQREHAKFT